MSTTKELTNSSPAKRFTVLLVSALLGMSGITLADSSDSAAQADGRVSKTLRYATGGRDNNRDPSKGSESLDAYAALDGNGAKVRSSEKSLIGDTQGATSRSLGVDFWIFDADVVLFNDDDADGFFHGIDLLFDADTVFDAVDVYAAVFLSLNGGSWNEYAVTEDFTIFGASSDDEFVLVTELLSGYPTGEYDLLIELYDAVDGSFLAEFGPADTSALSLLPLEDFDRDAPFVDDVVVIVDGGGGATGLVVLLLLMLAIAAIRVREQSRASQKKTLTQ